MAEIPNKLGKYTLAEQLGSGAFGWVYKATDPIGRTVAVKVLKPGWGDDPQTIERFRREAQVAGELFHNRIATILDFDESEGRLFLVMRYVDGVSLDKIIKEKGHLAWPEALEILSQVADGLDYAHRQGFVHRDIKPANILVGEKVGAVLTDFGLVKAAEINSGSSSGAFLGTPSYIAPEIWSGKPASPATDIYSLACVAYEMLTGNLLFGAASTPEILAKHVLTQPQFPEHWGDDVPSGLNKVLLHALTKNANERYQGVLSFVSDLKALGKTNLGQVEVLEPTPSAAVQLENLPVSPLAPAVVEPEVPFQKILGARFWMVGLLVVFILLVFFLSGGFGKGGTKPDVSTIQTNVLPSTTEAPAFISPAQAEPANPTSSPEISLPAESTNPVATSPTFSDSPDWPMNNHDTRRSSFNAVETSLIPPLKLLWHQKFPNYVAFNMSVIQDHLAVSGMGTLNGFSEMIIMLNAKTGDQVWQFDDLPTGSTSFDLATAQNGTKVIFPVRNDPKKFYALDMLSGSLAWTRTMDDFYSSEMAIYGDIFYLTDLLNNIVALDVTTGASVWNDPLKAWGLPLAIEGNKAFIVTHNRSSLSAINLDTKETIWEYPGLQSDFPWLVLGENTIFVKVSDSGVASLYSNGNTAKENWSVNLAGSSISEAGGGFAYNKLFVPVFTNQQGVGELLTLDGSTGEQLWKFAMSAEGIGNMAIANQVVYICGPISGPQIISALSAETGNELWSYQLDSYCTDVIVSRGILYVTADKGGIYAFSTGQ